jgi:hypothetical protein
MSNKPFKPLPGQVYVSVRGVYRMYVKIPFEENLLCVNLCTGESYTHSKENGLTDPQNEVLAFDMCEIVNMNK